MKSMYPIRVMLIDDQTMMLDGWQRVAAKVEDINITHTATTEKEALEILERARESFDVVVVDMEMPKGDPEAGLRLIEAESKKPGAPRFLAISGVMMSPEFIIRASRIGAAGYTLKTTSDLDRFFDDIRRVHRGERVFPPNIIDYVLDERSTWLQLNDRDKKIWQLIAEGKTNKEIAKELNFSVSVIKTQASELYSKLGVASRTQATRKWMEEQYGMQEFNLE